MTSKMYHEGRPQVNTKRKLNKYRQLKAEERRLERELASLRRKGAYDQKVEEALRGCKDDR